MATYSPEFKEKVIKQLLPPHNLSLKEISIKEAISESTLYTWRHRYITKQGIQMSTKKPTSADNWSPEQKLAVVVETYSMNSQELNEYSRSKGLYPEQIKSWKKSCLSGYSVSENKQQAENHKIKKSQKKIRTLEKELHRKEKALAEAAALLTLGKKYDALWAEKEDD